MAGQTVVIVVVTGQWRRERRQRGRVGGEDIVEGGRGAGDGERIESVGGGGGSCVPTGGEGVGGALQGRH